MHQSKHLTEVERVLKLRWFDLIACGMKRVEYRRDYEFWRKRIEGKEFVTFHRGYTNETMTFTINRVKRVGATMTHLGDCLSLQVNTVERLLRNRGKKKERKE